MTPENPHRHNQLGEETSPYLLQHADNPVAWLPWGEQALSLAREQNKPILLSVGYSACHWCHVMAHESFEDDETAAIMNEHFINVKVDREERPDLDKIYQRAHQLLTQRPGGWPLTMFLTPDEQIPFYGGTYFPKTQRHGLPAFKDLLLHISKFWQTRRDELKEQNESVMRALNSLQPKSTGTTTELTAAPLDMARRELEQSTDWKWGGFGQAPKFPHPSSLERLLRHWANTHGEDQRALDTACFSLTAMANGGVNDQIGGGFCRYSVDDYWMIPHFEKMLYDNGPLLWAYAMAWQISANPLYKKTVYDTVGWVMREMQSDAGGYFSSLDADSEGHEGKFYVWSQDELKDVLSEEEYRIAGAHFGFDREANFEGAWNPHCYVTIESVAEKEAQAPEAIETMINSARSKLFKRREQRIRPGRDDKILTSWNGLMIKGMAIASRIMNEPSWQQSATRAFDFIRATLWKDNSLLATYKDGKAHLNAYLDDYVFMIDAGLHLLQNEWNSERFAWTIKLADYVLEEFEDKEHGGFFFTSNSHEALIQRPKPLADEAIPSGNGVACVVLARLGHILGEQRYLDAAERGLQLAYPSINQYASAHNTLLDAVEEHLKPPTTVVIRGKSEEIQDWSRQLYQSYQPRLIVLAIPDSETELPGLMQQRVMIDSKTTAYVCSGTQCQAPVFDKQALQESLT